MRQGDLGRAAQKVVAHTQGEPGGEHGILQGVLQAPEGDSGSVRSGAKHRENASGLPRKPEEPRGQDGGQISAAHQIAVGVLVRQIVQELKIGYGMIQPWPIQRPIEEKPAEAGPEASLYCQHGVGIILLHGKAVYLGSLGRVTQGVKIPQNAGGLQSQRLEMPQAAIGG